MAIDKYLNLQGLTEVAEYVNEKLKKVTSMPITPSINDVVLYNGPTTANYKQGCIYLYTVIKTYYKWSDLSNTYYTESANPTIGDVVYVDTLGTDSGYTVTGYDNINNQITINSLTYNRDSSGDVPIKNWVLRSGAPISLSIKDNNLFFDLD